MECIISWALDLQDRIYSIGAGYPETRKYINEKNRFDITSRRTQLISGYPFHKEEFGWLKNEANGLLTWEKNTQGIIKELDARLAVLNVKFQEPDHILNSQANQEKRLSASHEKLLLLARSSSTRKKGANSSTKSSHNEGPVEKLTLANLRLVSANDTQENVAQWINLIWESLPKKVKINHRSRISNDSRAAAAAVFKLMQYLGKMDLEPSATK